MMTRRFALVVGNSEYEDASLSRLKTPDADVRSFAAALRDPALGGFDEVQEIINQPETAVSRAISTFFANKKPDDLLLLYFSGHGVLDPQGRLFLAVKDTQRTLLNATAIPAAFITDDMDTCRSRRQILILDCCHSGAFARGSKGDAPAVTKATFEGNGYGRVVLTASDSTQYALEGDQVIQQAALSLFTHYLLEGLAGGGADSDQDGWITLDEWYDYAYERVIKETPTQTPRKWIYNQQGELVVARNPRPPQPQELPQELQAALQSQFAGIRLGAVQELTQLLRGRNPALADLARAALQEMAEHDDSRRVSSSAAQVLAEAAASVETQQPGVSTSPTTGVSAADSGVTSTAEQEPPAGEKIEAESEAPANAGAKRQIVIEAGPAHPKDQVDVDRRAAPPLRREKPTGQVTGLSGRARLWGPLAALAALGVISILALAIVLPRITRGMVAGPTPTLRPASSQLPAILQTSAPLINPTLTSNPIVQALPTHTVQPSLTPTVQPSLTPEPTPLPLRITDDRGVPMVLVPAGPFQMGSDADDSLSECQKYRDTCDRSWFLDEEPIHTVSLDAFYIDVYEVTNERYAACVQSGACSPPSEKGSYTRSSYYDNPEYADYPVMWVNWFAARSYCAWRQARLPTEAEWEKAARGEDHRKFPWGDGLAGNLVNTCDRNCSLDWALKSVDDGYGDTAPVGAYPAGASPYGVMDMAGNLWEWVSDWYAGDYYSHSIEANPLGPETGEERVIRGGSWDGYAYDPRSGNRGMHDPADMTSRFGFRCVRMP